MFLLTNSNGDSLRYYLDTSYDRIMYALSFISLKAGTSITVLCRATCNVLRMLTQQGYGVRVSANTTK